MTMENKKKDNLVHRSLVTNAKQTNIRSERHDTIQRSRRDLDVYISATFVMVT